MAEHWSMPLFVRISLNLLFFLKKVCARRGCPDAARHLDCAQSILVQPGGIWDTAAGKPAAASARAGNFRSISLGRTGMMDSSSGRRALGTEAVLDPARSQTRRAKRRNRQTPQCQIQTPSRFISQA
jgi:hypothetical protein